MRLRCEAKIIFYSYTVDMTFLASRRLERNNVWGPTDRPIDRSLHVGEQEEVVGVVCTTWKPPVNLLRGTGYVCVCIRVCTYVFARPGVNPRDVGGKEDGDEGERERGTSAGTTGCKMPPSLCTHLHTAFHVCVATCEIQATLSFPSFLSTFAPGNHPRACTTYRVRDVPHFVRISLKFEEVTRVREIRSVHYKSQK